MQAIWVDNPMAMVLISISAQQYYQGISISKAWWRHQMETFSVLLAICAGIHQWYGALVFLYPPAMKLGGVYWIHPVCLSVCLSVRLSVCPLTFCVRPVASTVQDGFFPYLVQTITRMRRCVACDDLWPWPISSRSFGLGLENRVRSVASTVLDGFLLYLA